MQALTPCQTKFFFSLVFSNFPLRKPKYRPKYITLSGFELTILRLTNVKSSTARFIKIFVILPVLTKENPGISAVPHFDFLLFIIHIIVMQPLTPRQTKFFFLTRVLKLYATETKI